MAGRNLTHRLYLVTLAAKGMLGLVQLAISVSIFLGLLDRMPALLRQLAAKELAEDPADFIAGRLLSATSGLPSAQTDFFAIYFAAHGFLHITVVFMLLNGWAWAYPMGILVLAAFIFYQAYEWLSVGGVMLPILSAIDLLVIWLTLVE